MGYNFNEAYADLDWKSAIEWDEKVRPKIEKSLEKLIGKLKRDLPILKVDDSAFAFLVQLDPVKMAGKSWTSEEKLSLIFSMLKVVFKCQEGFFYIPSLLTRIDNKKILKQSISLDEKKLIFLSVDVRKMHNYVCRHEIEEELQKEEEEKEKRAIKRDRQMLAEFDYSFLPFKLEYKPEILSGGSFRNGVGTAPFPIPAKYKEGIEIGTFTGFCIIESFKIGDLKFYAILGEREYRGVEVIIDIGESYGLPFHK